MGKPRKRKRTPAAQGLPECRFLIPLNRDSEISDGKPHTSKCWRWLKEELVYRFGAWSAIPGVEGAWKSPKTGKAIADQSTQYTVAVADQQLGEVRMLLREACIMFAQQCIYLSIAGRVEFVEPE